MTAWLAALLLAATVVLLIAMFGLVRRSRAVFGQAEASLAVIGDRSLDDDGKERALRGHAFQLFRSFIQIATGGALALLLPLALLRLADRGGLVSEERVHDISLSWPFIVGSALFGLGFFFYRRPGARGSSALGLFENRYNAIDRWLHHLAFASTPVQVVLSRAEDRVHRRRLALVRPAGPVFITALPRAGTTLLLNVCAQHEEFATHTYRRMPFLLTPLWWESFSRAFRLAGTPRERAHGDGLLVSADSPEALEEMLWLEFWPEHYEADRVRPWSAADTNPEFTTFFTRHMQKIVALGAGRGGTVGLPRRYVSKNNANIARIAWLARMFPDARFVIPFRSPLQHVASLHRQHRRFSEIHRGDAFARHYMANIGHFDFGANHRPIDFGGWAKTNSDSPLELVYWLRYWTATYRHLSALAQDRVCFVDFEALCASPQSGLERLSRFLDVAQPHRYVAASRDIRRPKLHDVDEKAVPAHLVADAHRVHARLQELAGTAREWPNQAAA